MRILITLIALTLATLLPAQNEVSLKATFNAAAALENLKNDHVVAFMTWKAGELPGDELPVIVAQSPTAPTAEMLRIYATGADKPMLLSSHGELGRFFSFFTTRERGGLLAALWQMPDGRMKLILFAYREHDVHVALETESDGLPEFVPMSGDAEPAVRVTIAAAGGKAGMPVQALFRWNGKSYQMVKALRAPVSSAPRGKAAKSAPKP